MMIDITGKRFRFFLISGVVILIGIISLLVFGLQAGIELRGGSLLTLGFEPEVDLSELRAELASLGYTNAVIQTTGEGDYLIRTTKLTAAEKTELKENLTAKFGSFAERGFEDIDPIIARQTARIAAMAVAIATIGIMLYITWAFRRMPKPFRYGTCAIIALLHDTLVALGVFALIGGVLGWEVNLMFITGLLAVIGYSINDTVIIFDRIRENLLESPSSDFEVIVNNSLVETLPRSLNTSLTTIITVLALLLFVGSTIQNFTVVLLVGIISGTYSSIGIASPLLVVWEKGEWRRFLRLTRKMGG